jgi:segregation and condensation protein B
MVLALVFAAQSRGRPSDPLARTPELARIEAALFATSEPLPSRRLAQAAGVSDGSLARSLVQRLAEWYEADGSAFTIQSVAGGWQLRTRPEYARWLSQMYASPHDLKLSPPALETLAIIAYRQPIMRSDVEAIRGVSCSELIRQLLERGLIRVVGHHDSLGRPVLYGTARPFLEWAGLPQVEALPDFERLSQAPARPAAAANPASDPPSADAAE